MAQGMSSRFSAASNSGDNLPSNASGHCVPYAIHIDQLIKGKKGLAIVIGTESVEGCDLDASKMKETFEELQFGVIHEMDVDNRQLCGIIEAAAHYPYSTHAPLCKVVAFYFAGHGGSNEQKPFVLTKNGDRQSVEDIVSPFYPINTKEVTKDIKRLFFFDVCLGKKDDAGRDEDNQQNVPLVFDWAVPAKGNTLVAFSVSLGYRARGDARGGYWTRHLIQHITKDKDISLVLADTYTATVDFTVTLAKERKLPLVQGPSWSVCMGRFNLRYQAGDSPAGAGGSVNERSGNQRCPSHQEPVPSSSRDTVLAPPTIKRPKTEK